METRPEPIVSPIPASPSEAARERHRSLLRRIVGTPAGGTDQRRRRRADEAGLHPDTTPVAPASLDPELGQRLESFLAMARRLVGARDWDEALGAIVAETRAGLGADGVTLRIIDAATRTARVAATDGLDESEVAVLPVLGIDDGWIGSALRNGRVTAWTDARTDPNHAMERYHPAIRWAGAIAAPIIHDGRAIGVLNASTSGPRAWSEGDVEFMATLATHAAVAMTTSERLSQSERRATQLATLQAASAKLSRAGSSEGVGRTVVEEARRIIDYDEGRVDLVELPDVLVRIAMEGRFGAHGAEELAPLRGRLGHGFTGWVAKHGQPILVADAASDPRGRTGAPSDEEDHGSVLAVPMRYDGVTVGVITLTRTETRPFTEVDLQLLTILADQAATANESARLLTRSRELAGELRRLLDMSSELSASLDPHQVANLIAGHLASALGADECAISYWDRPSGRVESLGYHPPLRLDDLEPFFLVEGFPETVRVLEVQETVVVDAADPDADPAEVALMTRDGNRMLAMLPLVAKGQSIGLVELFSRSAKRWSEEHLAFARTMANEAAMALENARLYEDARKLADRDPLTGFYNHRFLHERLGEEVVRSQRGRRPLSVLMLDLDDFKLVNDTFGHLFGDRVLVWCADLIRSTLRASDIPARYGGDEFAVILPDTDLDAARVAAERILEAFRDRPFVGEQRGPVPLAGSIGVATFPSDGRTATDLIAAADQALYRVKREGGHDAATASDGTAA